MAEGALEGSLVSGEGWMSTSIEGKGGAHGVFKKVESIHAGF